MRSPCRRRLPPFTACAAMGVACILLAAGARGEARDEALPGAGGGDVAPGTTAPPTAPALRRAVYVCRDGSIPMFADRPCGAAAVARTLDVAPPLAGDAASLTPPVPRAATRPRRLPELDSALPEPAGATRCDALRRQLTALDDRMRTGYSAREAARLWQRWRDLRERLRTARC